jgi:ankyrin repeat protein
VEDWLSQDGADPNQRDYTGRTPLHLAVTSSTPEVVKCLVDHGARLIARLADGRTALHLAAGRGNTEMVQILLEKSSANEEEEGKKEDQRRKVREASSKDNEDEGLQQSTQVESDGDEYDGELVDDDDSDDETHSVTTGSFVKVDKEDEKSTSEETIPLDDDESDPDFYDIDVVAWDSHCSALHLAILGGHTEVVKLLCQEFAADILIPVKLGDGSHSDPRSVILTLVLALALPVDKAISMAETLLSLGATSSQADVNGITAFHRYVQHGMPKLIESLWENDKLGLKTAINHIAVTGNAWNSNATTPLLTAIDKGDPILVLRLLGAGANPEIDFDSWLKGAKFSFENNLGDYETNQVKFKSSTEQPLVVAIRSAQPGVAVELLKRGADPNTITKASHDIVKNEWSRRHNTGQSALDVVRQSLKALREYEEDPSASNKQHDAKREGFHSVTENRFVAVPEGPRGVDSFLHNFNEGTYRHWVVSTDIKEKTLSYKQELKRFEAKRKENDNQTGVKEKHEAIADIISQLEDVEKALVKEGAKTFSEQYPDIQAPSVAPTPHTVEDIKDYRFGFDFRGVKDVTEIRKAAYIEL